MAEERIWFVRAGKDAVFADEFRTAGRVAIGWSEAGFVAADIDDRALSLQFANAYPGKSEGTRAVWTAQVKRFLREIAIGDRVMTYDTATRYYLLGAITSAPEWLEGHPLPRVRRVTWTQQTARDVLTAATRNSLGSIATFFRVSADAAAEVLQKAQPLGVDSPPIQPPVTEPEGVRILREDVAEKADQFIEDRIAALDWSDMQELVAGILRAMGYKTRVAQEGGDRGVDIFASPDGLGLQEPRIFVEVKHRKGA